jgi:BirA family biotin operon repressor/biotin-[acetyl-CoA-carboxylase] ligase
MSRPDRDAILAALPPSARAQVATLVVADETGSTQADALAAPVPTDGVALYIADRQTAGQGRRGRAWVSPPDANLYLSAARRFTRPLPQLGGLSLSVGVAVVEALQALGVGDAGLKWPNDVLVGGRKLGGILVDARADGAGSIAVVGIGLNLRMPADAAAAIDQPWCDLAGLGHSLSRDTVAASVTTALVEAFAAFDAEGLGPFLARWSEYDALAGRAARLLEGERDTIGTVLGVDARGALRFATAEGERLVHSGELSLRPA